MMHREDEIKYLEQELYRIREARIAASRHEGMSFNPWEQGDYSGRVKFRDFEQETEDLMEREVRIRIRLEKLREIVRPFSGARLIEFYPTMFAPGALLKFDSADPDREGRWKDAENNPCRNLPIGLMPCHYGNQGHTLTSPFVLVRSDAISTLLPGRALLVMESPWIKIMVNSNRRDSDILWSPISDLILL